MIFAGCWFLGLAMADDRGSAEKMMAEVRRDVLVELTKANDPAAAGLLPAGIRPAELTMRRRNLEQTLLAIGRYEKAEASVPELQRAVTLAAEADQAWLRFDEPPPHSIVKFDQLLAQRDALLGKIASLESSIDIMNRASENLTKEAKTAAEHLRRLTAETESGSEPSAWRLQSAHIESQQIQVRKAALAANQRNLLLQLDAARHELSLLDRQLGSLGNDVAFREEDLKAVQAASEQRQAALREELREIQARQSEAIVVRDRAIAGRDKAIESRDPDTRVSDTLTLAITKAEAAEATSDSLQLIAEAIEWLLQIEQYHLAAQEERREMMSSDQRDDRDAAEAAIRSILDRLRAWEIVASNELISVSADLAKVEAIIASLPENDPGVAPRKQQQAVFLERQSAVQRVVRAVTNQSQMLERWVAAHESRKRSAGERIADFYHAVVRSIRTFLGIEVFTYEDEEKVQKAVSLGKLITALLLFIIPYVVVHFIVRRVKRTTVSMKMIGEAQANTLGNWLTILVAVPLALMALNFLKIPLTIFAFLGGALVIGLGFGMQTMIKNFISGIIILFERRVRVGDIVDVEGTVGTVTEINTRSSVIRSPDGLETMVPNSLFLENRVTSLTLSNRSNRRVIRIGVAYGTQPTVVIDALRECVDRHGLVLKDPAPMVLFEDFGDNALIFMVYFWVEFNEKTNPLQVSSDLRIMIEKRLTELGIAIPYPQRDLHFAESRPLTVRLEKEIQPGGQP